MSKLIDETGNIYGYLKVIERGPNTSDGRATWICECKCGKKVVVKGVELRNGHVKSCGCYQKERTSESIRNDFIGKTIGNFTVLEGKRGEAGGERRKWRCRCNLCGSEQNWIATSNLLKQFSCGCIKQSQGELKIQQILIDNNIVFVKEKRFSSCTFETGKVARFDFYLPDYNTLIEYDGIQHYIEGNGKYDNKEKFQLTQQHDLIKNQWCEKENINLIRIPYTHFNEIKFKDLLPQTSEYLVIKEVYYE